MAWGPNKALGDSASFDGGLGLWGPQSAPGPIMAWDGAVGHDALGSMALNPPADGVVSQAGYDPDHIESFAVAAGVETEFSLWAKLALTANTVLLGPSLCAVVLYLDLWNSSHQNIGTISQIHAFAALDTWEQVVLDTIVPPYLGNGEITGWADLQIGFAGLSKTGLLTTDTLWVDDVMFRQMSPCLPYVTGTEIKTTTRVVQDPLKNVYRTTMKPLVVANTPREKCEELTEASTLDADHRTRLSVRRQPRHG